MSPYINNYRRQAQQPQADQEPTRVNLGPLTTAFVPPSHCSRAALANPTDTKAWRGQLCQVDPAGGLKPSEDVGCWPRATSYPPPKETPVPLANLGYFSPGIMCPTGYFSACTAISQGASGSAAPTVKTKGPLADGQFQFPLVAGETAVGCCPTGYTCGVYSDGGHQSCHQVATSTQFDALVCDGRADSDVNNFAIPITAGANTISTMNLWAPLVQINHKATDLPETSTPSARSTSSSFSSVASSTASSGVSSAAPSRTRSDISPQSAATSALPTATGQADERLPFSTKAAIAFSPIIVGAIVAAILGWFWLKKRKDGKLAAAAGGPKSENDHGSGASFQSNSSGANVPAMSTPVMYGGAPISPPRRVDVQPEDAHLNQTLSQEQDARESPVDGTSPFRLKRGNTKKDSTTRASPLGRTPSTSTTVTASSVYTALTRDNSFSRPRPLDGPVGEARSGDWCTETRRALRNTISYSRPRPIDETGNDGNSSDGETGDIGEAKLSPERPLTGEHWRTSRFDSR